MGLVHVLDSNKMIRSIGFDDASFERGTDEPVGVAGVVCEATRFEGLLWGAIQPDGWDATETVLSLLEDSKFLPQLHLVLVDGIAFGGFNILDLERLADRLERPTVAVMRSRPNVERIESALQHVSEPDRRLAIMQRAGDVHEAEGVYFQVQGTSPDIARRALEQLQYDGHIPEPLRMAHLIATAVETGESGRRA
jgi:endonuclease V-like protein UPF0215 family